MSLRTPPGVRAVMQLLGHPGNVWRHTSMVALPVFAHGGGKNLVQQTVGKVEGSLENLKNSFCLRFFPPNKVIDLRCEVFNF